jgi:hypothetical protein
MQLNSENVLAEVENLKELVRVKNDLTEAKIELSEAKAVRGKILIWQKIC